MNRFTKRFDKTAAKSLCLPNHYVVISERTVLLDVIFSWPIDYCERTRSTIPGAIYEKYQHTVRIWSIADYAGDVTGSDCTYYSVSKWIYMSNKKHAYIIFLLSHMYSYSTEYLYISLSADTLFIVWTNQIWKFRLWLI